MESDNSLSSSLSQHLSLTHSLKCLRCGCRAELSSSSSQSASLSVNSSCVCLCCHSKDSSCVYTAIDHCIDCHEKYTLQYHPHALQLQEQPESHHTYFSCSRHCSHLKSSSSLSSNFHSLSRRHINRQIPPSGKTLLHSSVLACDPDLTWDLLLKGANPFIPDASGMTPIDLAKYLCSAQLKSNSNEKIIYDILPKISFPDTAEAPIETKLRTQSDFGPDMPNSFSLSPKRPRIRKQALRNEKSIHSHKKHHYHRTNKTHLEVHVPAEAGNTFISTPHPTLLSFSPPTSPTYLPEHQPSTSPKSPRKKRSMTLTASSLQYPPEPPRIHIHNNTISKTTSHLLSRKERAMSLTDSNPLVIYQALQSINTPSTVTTLSYGRTRRERAQTITDSSFSKANKIVQNGKIISTSWDTKRPLLRGLVQSGYRYAISNAPDLLKGKQIFTPLTLIKLSSDNNDVDSEDLTTPNNQLLSHSLLHLPHNHHPHFQPMMSSVEENDAENENVDGVTQVKSVPLTKKVDSEWILWEISQFREIIINEVEIEISIAQKKNPSRTPSTLVSRAGSHTDLLNLDRDGQTISRSTSQKELSTMTKSSKGDLSNKDITSLMSSDSPSTSRISTPPPTLQAPTSIPPYLSQGVASRSGTSSPSTKPRIDLRNIIGKANATPPILAQDASAEDVENAFTMFAQSINSPSTSIPPLPKHLKVLKSGSNTNSNNLTPRTPPPASPAPISTELDDKPPSTHYDNIDSVDISAQDDDSSSQSHSVEHEIILTCTGCYDELPSSQMVYTCARMGCHSHLCQECLFRSVFITITSALYAVPRIKCPGRCMHTIPTRVWRGILRGMKMSDEDKLTVKVEDQYPVLRLLDLLYESFEIFCSDYEGIQTHTNSPKPHDSSDAKMELQYVHICDMLKRVETIMIQDGFSLNDLYNTAYELGKKKDKKSDDSESDDSESDDSDSETEVQENCPEEIRTDITSFEMFSRLVYADKIIADKDLESIFLLMEDILNDSEIESNRLGINKIRKLRLCVFLSHAAVIIRTRLDVSKISSDYVGNYVMNIYHNDAESLLIKKYIHNANALLTIRCGGCDDTVSLYHSIENGKLLITEKSEREKVLNKILGRIRSSSASTEENNSSTLYFFRNWMSFCSHRLPSITFVSNLIQFYLNTLERNSENSKNNEIELLLSQGILHVDLLDYLNDILSMILDIERRFVIQLELYRKYPKIRVNCCDTKHCFLCKIQGHHKNKTCNEIQNAEMGTDSDGVNLCQYCPGCGVATLRSEGCNEIMCVCGTVWKWKVEEKKKHDGGDGQMTQKTEDDDDEEDSEDDESESDSWDDDSDEESDED